MFLLSFATFHKTSGMESPQRIAEARLMTPTAQARAALELSDYEV